MFSVRASGILCRTINFGRTQAPVFASRSKVLLVSLPFASPLLLPFFGHFRSKPQVALCEDEPPQHMRKLPAVSFFQVICRFLKLSIFLLPISLMLSMGWLAKGSNCEVAPKLFVRCLEWCGPTFVKLGQWLATRRDVLSGATCDSLTKLHEGSDPTFDVDEREIHDKCLQGGLRLSNGGSPVLLGSGCISQVYKETLESGEEVAVKLRRPHVHEDMAADFALLHMVANFAQIVYKDLKWLNVSNGLSEFATSMEAQLDFRMEAYNMRRLRTNFANDRFVELPKVHHASDDVIVTTLVGQTSLGELMKDENVNPAVKIGLWDVLGRMVAKMVFSDNFMHQDLHPGNIRITIASDIPAMPSWFQNLPEAMKGLCEQAWLAWPFSPAPFKVHLIDSGLALQVSRDKIDMFKGVAANACKGCSEDAGQAFLTLHERLGHADFAVAKKQFSQSCGNLASATMHVNCDWKSLGFCSEAEYKDSRFSDFYGMMVQLFAAHRIRMDPEIWSIFASFAVIDGVMRDLNGSANLLSCMVPYLTGTRS